MEGRQGAILAGGVVPGVGHGTGRRLQRRGRVDEDTLALIAATLEARALALAADGPLEVTLRGGLLLAVDVLRCRAMAPGQAGRRRGGTGTD